MAEMLPGAVPAPAEFAMSFLVVSKDLTNNNPHTLLNPFLHNLNDGINNVSTENIRDRLAAPGHRQFAICSNYHVPGPIIPLLASSPL